MTRPLNSLAAILAGVPPPTNSLASLLSLSPTPTPPTPVLPVPKWIYVRRRFSNFLSNISMTKWQLKDGETKQAGIRSCLNRHYWGNASETDNSILIGSWGKQTRVRPGRDIDILFLLPPKVYWRFEKRTGNRQSQLLQEIKDILSKTHSQTRMRGDGQVVVVPFNTIEIEVAPGFRCQDGSIIICDTNDEGEYKTSTAEAEARDFELSNIISNGNARALVRMLKQWQNQKNIPLKSFQLERLAVDFMRVWPYRHHDVFWYDWMVRDFFAYLLDRINGYIVMPGTYETIPLGADWQSRAETAYWHAVTACKFEYDNFDYFAGAEWQEIFGNEFPKVVS